MGLRDWMVAIAVALSLVVASWALGGVRTNTRVLLLILAAFSFLCCFLPLPRSGLWGWIPAGATARENLLRLIRFPVFWLGLILMGYVFLQAINPAYFYVEHEGLWWVSEQGLEPREGWPQSIVAPMNFGSPWGFMIRWGGGLLLLCAVWVGVRRRRALFFIFWTLALNAAVYSLIAILQQLTGATEVLWTFDWGGRTFSGAFFYRNHGAAFLVLCLTIVLCLALYSRRDQALRMKVSGPFPLLFSIAVLVVGALVAVLSRGGWVGGAIVVAGFIPLLLYSFIRFRSSRGEWMGSLAIMVAVIAFGGYVYSFWDREGIHDRYLQLLAAVEEVDRDTRMIGNQASLRMFEDRHLYGWGADNYAVAFIFYMNEFPELMRARRGIRSTSWVAAHNDSLQLLAELGIVGITPITLMLLFFLGHWLRRLPWFREWTCILLVGIAAFASQTMVDLHLLSGTLLFYFLFMMVALSRFLDFQRERGLDTSVRGHFTPRAERAWRE